MTTPPRQGGVTPAHHWVLTEHPIPVAELEALAVSRALGVSRVDERTLAWEPGVIFQGPMTPAELENGGVMPEWVGAVYHVRCPRERGAPVPPELNLPGSTLTAFDDGEPIGVERDTLETLEAISRRVGGGVLTETGVLVIPEPRTDVLLYSATWLEQSELGRLLSGVSEFIADGDGTDPEAGYAMVAQTGDGEFLVTASHTDITPIALAGYGWATGEVYVYEFRYYAYQTFQFSRELPTTPAQAQEGLNLEASAMVERIARTALRATGGQGMGHLCDDDGFLVLL